MLCRLPWSQSKPVGKSDCVKHCCVVYHSQDPSANLAQESSSPPTWLSALVAPKQTTSTSTGEWMRKRSLGQGSVSESACLGPKEEVTMLQNTLYVSPAIVLSECASRERVKVAAWSSSLSLKLCLAKRMLLVKVLKKTHPVSYWSKAVAMNIESLKLIILDSWLLQLKNNYFIILEPYYILLLIGQKA